MDQTVYVFTDEILRRTALAGVIQETFEIASLRLGAIDYPQIERSFFIEGRCRGLARFTMKTEEIQEIGFRVGICRANKCVTDSVFRKMRQLLSNCWIKIAYYFYCQIVV